MPTRHAASVTKAKSANRKDGDLVQRQGHSVAAEIPGSSQNRCVLLRRPTRAADSNNTTSTSNVTRKEVRTNSAWILFAYLGCFAASLRAISPSVDVPRSLNLFSGLVLSLCCACAP